MVHPTEYLQLAELYPFVFERPQARLYVIDVAIIQTPVHKRPAIQGVSKRRVRRRR